MSLKDLNELVLADNALTELADTLIEALPKLRLLDVSGNQLTTIPAAIAKLSFLRYLKLRNNKLSTAAVDVLDTNPFDLDALEEVDLAQNRLTLLPTFVVRLKGLKSLVLTNNSINTLVTPTELNYCDEHGLLNMRYVGWVGA